MASQWDRWLAELSKEGKLAGEEAVPFAMRGFAWGMQISIAGDFTGYNMFGRIKASPDNPANLAVMSVYGPVLFEGNTLWELSLPATGTDSVASLGIDTDGDAVEKYPFLLVLAPPSGAPYPLIGGLLTLLGGL